MTISLLVSPITIDDVRRMLRGDAVSFALGAVLVMAAFITLALSLGVRRRRIAAPRWLALFALIYGSRLLLRTDIFRLGFDIPRGAAEYIAAAITYCVPLPIVLFAREIAPAWRRVYTWMAVGLAAFAAYGITADLILRHPNSAIGPNNVIAIAFMIGLVVALFRPGLTPTRELRVLRIGLAAVSFGAVADNLRGLHIVSFSGPDLEPIGFTVALICLAQIVAWRALGESRRLAALDRELGIARQIQASILPQAMPRVSGLTIAARYRPMTAVAGDFYDFIAIDGDRLGVLVADVSGHGVPAALIASMVKVALAAQQDRADHPADVLAGMNRALCERLGGQYVTAAYLYIDARAGLMRYAAAGHPPLLHATPRSPEFAVHELQQNGMVLGFFEQASYQELEQPLGDGDRLLLYTDGLIEAPNAADEFFDLARVKPTLAAGAVLHPDAAADALLATMHTWSGQPAHDDLTLVLIDYHQPVVRGAAVG